MTQLTSEIIARALSELYGHDVPIRAVTPVGNDSEKDDVPDATLKFLAPLADGTDGFLIASGPGNTALVQRGVDNIAAARAAVSDRVAAYILPPDMTGTIQDRSFALWPRFQPYERPSRLGRMFQSTNFYDSVLQWSTDFACETRIESDPQETLRMLSLLSGDEGLPGAIVAEVKETEARISSGDWTPVRCFQHSDYWYANILRADPGAEVPFYVIDWSGLIRNSYPFLDLTKMMWTLACNPAISARHIDDHCQRLGCERQDASAYLLCGLATIRQNLEHFPIARFRELVVDKYGFLNARL